jgi:hypothetical protein
MPRPALSTETATVAPEQSTKISIGASASGGLNGMISLSSTGGASIAR